MDWRIRLILDYVNCDGHDPDQEEDLAHCGAQIVLKHTQNL